MVKNLTGFVWGLVVGLVVLGLVVLGFAISDSKKDAESETKNTTSDKTISSTQESISEQDVMPTKNPVLNTDSPSKPVEPKDYGKKTIVNGTTYNFNVGDKIVLVVPNIDEYEYYGVSWYGAGAVSQYYNYNSPESAITAVKAGETKIGVYINGKRNGEQEELNYEVTFKVVDPSANSSGDSSGGSSGGYYPVIPTTAGRCNYCNNIRTVDCGACVDGWITTHFMDVTERKQCDRRGCVGGRIDCSHCN